MNIHCLDSVVFPKIDNPVTMRVISLFAEADRPLCLDEIVSRLCVDMSMVQFCVDLLIEHNLIVQSRAGFESSWTERDFPDLYVLTSRGRQCIHEWKATSQ
jgi:hypothetical protein